MAILCWILTLPLIIHGDSQEVLKTLAENSIDAVVTDPPYGLSFMGKKWDYDVPSSELWREVLRVLKPGGHLLSFGGTRTYHRMVVAIEDAGFEIRDQVQWIYGSGFPKSMNIGKKVETHQGWGTALKPANEPIVLARKPLSEKTVAANVLKWGTGALNIDGSRIVTSEKLSSGRHTTGDQQGPSGYKTTNRTEYQQNTQGRWPANILFDESAAVMLDEQSEYVGMKNGIPGGASRFFYIAKASKRERNAGLEGMPTKTVILGHGQAACPKLTKDGRPNKPIENQNHHPTVKPIKLMEYLCKLIAPPGGTILDPFCGSGSTGVACLNLSLEFVGIEREAEYVEIAKRRTAI